jgi:hypothetical protein
LRQALDVELDVDSDRENDAIVLNQQTTTAVGVAWT